MKITEALIERYLNNACDEEEQRVIRNYFIRHPEALQRYLTERSWHSFKPEGKLPEEVSESMLAVIRNNTYQSRKLRITRWRWASVAALLVLALSTYWYTQLNSDPAPKLVAKKIIEQPKQSYTWQLTSNTSATTLSLTLEDGSRIQLAPQSELTYPVPFENTRRHITLKGQAVFYVAKDPSRPFTVHAGRLATTAIGTVFRITAFEGNTTRVQLLSGKVRVEADSALSAKGLKSTFLLPGQEVQLNTLQHLVVINRKEKIHKNVPSLLAKQKVQHSNSSTVTIFHNEPLDQLLITLSNKYHTKISFRPEQVAGITFTGKFDQQKETLLEFIQTISSLNNLVAMGENGEIRILSQ